ncbi:DUF4097 family beta strand repeat-containing protein [Enterococcus sp. AZ109]|uniref:DUF4097 family beta strand repeat-containing protein n=1 Tax=Enterococcus sp. AZ109 TaxID=2774634 RepID=UPI003F288FC4
MKKITVGVILVGLAIVSMSSMVFHNRTTNKTFETQKAVESIIIDDSDTPITVTGTSGNKTTVKYKESRNNKYRVEEDGNELRVERKNNWFPLSWLSFGGKQGEVVVEVPNDQLEELMVETGNGHVSVENLSLDFAHIESSNAEIKLSDLTVTDTLDAQTSNGAIILKDLTFTDGEFITTNAKMDVDNLEGDSIWLETSNGHVTFDKVKVTDTLSVESSNSHIKGNVIGKQSDFEIYSDTSNGRNVPGNTEGSGEKMISADTSNGDIVIEFTE